MLLIESERMLPAGTLVVRDKSTWLRKHNPELVLLISLLTLVVAIVALFGH
jgi:hypothetical protein